MNARRFPGVRCSTLKTECRSLLCLMIMPGRSWVAGIDIAWNNLLQMRAQFAEPAEELVLSASKDGQANIFRRTRAKNLFYTQVHRKGNLPKAGFIVEEPHSLPRADFPPSLAED